MRNPALRALRAVSTHTYVGPCRFVAGCRLSLAKRTFHTSPTQRRDDDPAETPWTIAHGQPPPSEVASPYESSLEAEGLLYNLEGGPETPPRPKDRSNYGSAARRAGRNIKRVKELPPVHIPPWFLERNVTLRKSQEEWGADLARMLSDPKVQAITTASGKIPKTSNENLHENRNSEADARQDAAEENLVRPERLRIHDDETLNEIVSIVSAGLQVPSWQRAENAASLKPHPMLYCPKDGTELLLANQVQYLAGKFGTDLLRLDPQDIAEIGGDYLNEPSEFQANTLSSLGYDAPLMAAARHQQVANDAPEEDDYEEADEDDTDQSPRDYAFPMPVRRGHAGGIAVVGGASFTGNLQDVFKILAPPGGSSQKNKPSAIQNSPQAKDMTPELKLGLLVETLLNAPEIKRVTERSDIKGSHVSVSAEPLAEDTTSNDSKVKSDESLPTGGTDHGSEGLIVLVQDYPQINLTLNGSRFIDKLHEVVDMRRKDGQKILIIGAASSKDLMPTLSWSAAKDLQNEPSEGPTRTVVVPIHTSASVEQFQGFPAMHKQRLKATNVRHIRDMLRRIAPNPARVASIVADWDLHMDSKTDFLSGLDESLWPMERVSRVATTALGCLEGSEDIMTSEHIEKALNIIELSDNAKRDWITSERELRKKDKVPSEVASSESTKERMRKLRKTCNDHERKLLNGVVNPDDIRTTFADVQAPPQTIDALKTLTSLSLVRPDAFTYGVLATDKIPGLLLYGPPGTGKTLLARAVAKESGATVLEVSGSDVYDMYVGEGEKNVKAIFSLAKKLTPCIVFIDEADAILGARSGGSNRTSHRELINQFLREWDGMNEMSAFIMVATNRPFDLDEASLRRLPRRLLIDLPQEKDRDAILKIHLKDEMLDSEVSLPQLASQTPFYSGSDLKNLAVAAALSCVREEFDAAASNTKNAANSEKYEYPEKRVLHPRHFTRAMEEISASVSEDMGSLSAIRKFDEKYGDRRGRRKKGGYGFKTVADSEKLGSDSARVRNHT